MTTVNPTISSTGSTAVDNINAEGQANKTQNSGVAGSPAAPGKGTAEKMGLELPKKISNSDLMAMLQEVKAKLEETQLKNSSDAINQIKKDKQNQAQKRLQEIKKMQAAQEKAKKKGLLGKIFGWIAAAVTTIVGGILVATGVGAGLGTIMLVGGITAMAAMALQETGAIEKMMEAIPSKAGRIALAATLGVVLIAAAVMTSAINPVAGLALAGVATALIPMLLSPANLEKMGASEETAAKIGIAITCLTIVSSLALAAASGGSSVMKDASKWIGIANMCFQGASSITQGALGIAGAVDQKEAADALANSKDIEKVLIKMQQLMQDETERLEEILKRMEENVNVVMEVLDSDATTNSRIAQI